MPKVVIIGNSGAARECYWLLREIQESDAGFAESHSFSGFLDWKGYAGDLKELQHFYLGTADTHAIQSDELFIIGIGKPELRRDIFMAFKARGASFINLIHPWTSISPTTSIGEGNIFHRFSTVHCNTIIGNGNYLNGAVNLSHDVQIGDFNFIAPYSIVLGNAHIENCNHLGPYSMILDHAHIGSGNILAPGGAVYKGCGDKCLLAGNPALKVGTVPDGENS